MDVDGGQEPDTGNNDCNAQTEVHNNQDANPPKEQINVDTGNTLTGRKRKLTSPAWDHFKRILENGQVVRAECNYCKKVLGAKSSNGTSHLLDHKNSCLSRKHKDIRQSVLAMGQKTVEGKADISCYNFNADTSRKDLAEMIIVHEYPLVMVEHHGFRKFVNGLQPFFKVPARNTIKREILKIFDYEKKNTMRILEKNKSKVAITTDMWTSSNQKKGFMTITSHLIDDNWSMQSRIMRFIYVPAPHTAENLAEVIHDTLCDWNLDRKLSTITVDNCSTNDALINILLEKLPWNTLILGGEILHMRCGAHILNIIVQFGLSVISEGIEKIRDSVSFWTITPRRVERFEKAANQLQIECTKKLALDCKTLWNSTYLMLNVAITYKDVFKRLKQQEPKYQSLPTERDWELATSICEKLKEFYTVTLLFSGTKYPTANIFFPNVVNLRCAMRSWLLDTDDVIKEMARNMIGKFDKYWSVIHGVMGIAAILDPRYKLKVIEFGLKRLYPDEQSELEVEKVKKMMYALFQDYETRDGANAKKKKKKRCSDMSTVNLDASSNGFMADFSKYVEEDNQSSTKVELDHYLQEAVSPLDSDFDILGWWKTEGSKYPILQRIARDILVVPISTVASESSFSTSGRLVTPHRSRLHPKTLEALMCAQSWLLTEIRATCSKESKAYCKTIEYDTDDDDDFDVNE